MSNSTGSVWEGLLSRDQVEGRCLQDWPVYHDVEEMPVALQES